MRNKIIILLILIVPIVAYAYLDYKTSNITADNASYTMANTIAKAKIIKFYSPMCSECKTVGKNVTGALSSFGDDIVFEEINVSDNSQKSQDMVQMYKVSVVPTLIFIDKTGRISAKKEGMIEQDEIVTNLESIK